MTTSARQIWQGRVYLLHHRPFKDRKILVDLFSAEHGVVSAVMSYGQRRRRGQSSIQAFQPYWCRLRFGCSDLLTVQRIELEKGGYWLVGDAVICGLYINELILKLCHPHDAHPDLFLAYAQVLASLALNSDLDEAALRCFDLCLLEKIGYGLPFKEALATQHEYYQYLPDRGFVPAEQMTKLCYSYEMIQAISERAWQAPKVLQAAKRLCRQAINHALQGKRLRCRELFTNI